jgi:glycosyltransferase involved in cell wall biosynthesis
MDARVSDGYFPSEETLGLVVAESLARNLKLSAAFVGGIADIDSGMDGTAGTNRAGLENTLVRWMKAGCSRPSGAAAVIRQRYYPEIIARRHLEIYREVLAFQ